MKKKFVISIILVIIVLIIFFFYSISMPSEYTNKELEEKYPILKNQGAFYSQPYISEQNISEGRRLFFYEGSLAYRCENEKGITRPELYYKYSPSKIDLWKNWEGIGSSSTYIVDCDKEYYIISSSLSFGSKVYGPFERF